MGGSGDLGDRAKGIFHPAVLAEAAELRVRASQSMKGAMTRAKVTKESGLTIGGITPPDGALGGVTEIRIHGVGGSTPQQLLNDPTPRQVAGDRVAGFYRTADQHGRHIEAYSWGGLTSRSRTRALWLILLPFLLANLAGWASAPRPKAESTSPGAVAVSAGTPVPAVDIAVAKLAAVATTIALLLVVNLVSLDVLAYQCGDQPSCVDQYWWLAPFGWFWSAEYPGRRLMLGGLIPIAILCVFALLSFASRRRYERVQPPTAVRPPGIRRGDRSGAVDPTSSDAAPKAVDPRKIMVRSFVRGSSEGEADSSAAELAGGLANPNFWKGAKSHGRLSRLHLAAGFALIAVTVFWCVRTLFQSPTEAVHAVAIGWAGAAVCVMTVGGVVALLIKDVRLQWPSGVLLLASIVGLLLVGLFAWLQPRADRGVGGPLPGMGFVITIVWAALAVILVVLLGLGIIREMANRTWRKNEEETARANRKPGQAVDSDPARPPRFRWCAPVVFLGFGLLLSHTVLLSIVVWVAALLDRDGSWALNAAGTPVQIASVSIVLPPTVYTVISYLVIGAGAIITLFVVCQGFRYRRSGRNISTGLFEEFQQGYHKDIKYDAPAEFKPWIQSAFKEHKAGSRAARKQERTGLHPSETSPTKWVQSQFRWRFLSTAVWSVSYLLSALVFAGILVSASVIVFAALTGGAPAPLLPTLTTAVALLLPVVLVSSFVLSWRQPGKRRLLGVLWDVGTFWPRSFHPFAPPCYSERSVPELLRRIWWLDDTGGRVLLVAHSQGSVLAAAAVARRLSMNPPSSAPAERAGKIDEIGLVTFGAPLRKLYHWGFPAYVPLALFTDMANGQSGLRLRKWSNIYYLTDYIGGEVSGDAGRPAVDRQLPDPATSLYVYGQDPPHVQSHTKYWTDAHFWAEVQGVADSLAVPPVKARTRLTHISTSSSARGRRPATRDARATLTITVPDSRRGIGSRRSR
jgi:uncharacterized membrane protein